MKTTYAEPCQVATCVRSVTQRRHEAMRRATRSRPTEVPRARAVARPCGAVHAEVFPDFVRSAELLDLVLELGDAALVGGGHTRAAATVNLGLADPAAQRLGPDAERVGNAGDGAVPLLSLFDGLLDHPDRSFTELGGVAVLRALGVLMAPSSPIAGASTIPRAIQGPAGVGSRSIEDRLAGPLAGRASIPS